MNLEVVTTRVWDGETTVEQLFFHDPDGNVIDLTCVEDGGDNRACPDDAPPDLTIPRIIRYNDDKRHEAFLHGIHDCMICFSELPGNSFFHFQVTVCTSAVGVL